MFIKVSEREKSMDLTARLWRNLFLCASISLSFGCSPVGQSSVDQTAGVEPVMGASEEGTADATASVAGQEAGAIGDASANAEIGADSAQQAESTTQTASSRILMSGSDKSIGIELIEGSSANQVVIGRDLSTKDYTVSRLHNPERIVVDLLNQKTPVNKQFSTEDSEYISSVRVGSHPGKNRVVLDLIGDSSLKHGVALDNGSLVLTVGAEGAAAPRMSAEAASPSQAAESVIADSSEPSQASDIVPVADSTDTITSDAAASTVSSIAIENAPAGGNMMVAEIAGSSPEHELKKTAPTEYVLTLRNSKLDANAAMTLLAPPSSGAIRSVRPVAEGNDVALRIFTTSLSDLETKTAGNRLLLGVFSSNAINANTIDTDDVRAQLAPEGAEEPKAEPAKSDKVEKAEPAKTESKTEPAAASSDTATTTSGEDLGALLEEKPQYIGRLISLDLQDTDIDNALRIIAEVSNLNIIASEDVTGKITLRLIDVPWDQALDVILKTNGLDKVQEGNVVRIAPVEKLRKEREDLRQLQISDTEIQPLKVEYARVSYAKAADLKPLVETVLSERGSVAYDERTNQLIIKDIQNGLKNVARLISKLDLRTPQILLETQIVESNRSLLRDLGAEFDFDIIRSPATGNPTGWNFPNSIVIGGNNPSIGGSVSSFPAAVGGTDQTGAAIGIVLGSADGTKSVGALISALESEGRVRVVSRPSVATTNNKPATIKSVTKFRIKLPSGGLSVATGQGATANGQSNVATEVVEVGIVLDVTPQASPDYYVLLDITAKSSTLGPPLGGDAIPAEIERSANSTVLVSSGQTFAMGGIYKISDNDTVRGVPFLKDIPVVGTLFRNTKVNNSDEELLFFLTPRIIEGSFDDAAMRAKS